MTLSALSRGITHRCAVVFLSICLFTPLISQAAEPDAIEIFEKHVRPLLAAQCYECHGPKKQQASLRLDSRESMLRGGESGPAIIPGEPDKSRLIAAVRREGDLQMPPESKLTADQVAVLTHWVKLGAPWPNAKNEAAHAKAAQHWAFQPIRDPSVPKVKSGSTTNPIDAFIHEKLDAAGLVAAPQADPRTLIRRATYDLTGLPPTLDEVQAFEQAAIRNPQSAIENLIDRLLASPHYGEQWARHWLDVARYSDTKGYVYAREERFWIHASSYRDWVVRSLNDDLPYNRFLLLQLAADQAAPDDPPSLAAMGFLTLGRRFLGVTHDIIDDRIDVVTRGTMGLTVACARCHDHKYDPIPTKDYYSLYGVFMNCRERVRQIAAPAADDETYQAFAKELQTRQKKLADATATAHAEWSGRVRSRVAEYLQAQFELQKYPEEGFDQLFSKDDILPAFVRQWQTYLFQAQQRRDPIFIPWHAFAEIPPADFSQRAEQVTRELSDRPAAEINPLVGGQFVTPPASMQEVCQRYGQVFAEIDRQWQAAVTQSKEQDQSPPAVLADPAAEALRQVLHGPHSPCSVPNEPIVHTESFFDLGTCEQLWKLQGEIDRWLIRSPQAPPYALYLVDREPTVLARVLKRGNPTNKGDVVPRQFLEVLAGPDRQPFQHGSGRLELAQAIIDPKNPLTARVIVNRVWQQHFGAGLVRTPSDFGTRAEAPGHPELLDWLATRFMEDGWSLKRLHRRIMMSSTYRQTSTISDFGFRISDSKEDRLISNQQSTIRNPQLIDPQNRLWWRANARRLSFEELRDSLLTAAGQLDLALGGKPGDLLSADFRRRTLYGLIDRQFFPSTLRVFDFANPDLHIPQRNETTAPQQALFFLNHPLLVQQAEALARRTEGSSSAAERVRQMYGIAYQRQPTAEQIAAAIALVQGAANEPAPVLPPTVADWKYGYGEYDEASKQLRGFAPLPYFSGKAWQGGPNWPDAKLGWVQLTAEGGHAGNDLKHAAVRRWTAPTDMTIRIDSEISHNTRQGDGVRAFLVHSREGLLKSAQVHNSQARLDVSTLEVRAGETLDFVVDIGGSLNNDQFTWPIEIKPTEAAAPARASAATWHSQRDFAGPPTARLTPWEQLAQVLLAANEFVFID